MFECERTWPCYGAAIGVSGRRPPAVRVAAWMALAVALAACGAGGRHEVVGDRAYVNEQFDAALVEYRLAQREGSSAALHRKAAFAALRAGELLAAAEEFVALAGASEESVVLAADGLERVAREAVDLENHAALQAALDGLTEVAQGRALGSFAQELAVTASDDRGSQEALAILPYAAVAASDVGGQDSLMFVYGRALHRLGRCAQAVEVFEGIVRRGRVPALERDAAEVVSSCALRLGQIALDRGMPEEGEAWYARAARVEAGDLTRRAAYVGIGDARVAMDDYQGAFEAYQEAREGLVPGDSLFGVVQRRVNAMFDATSRFQRERGPGGGV